MTASPPSYDELKIRIEAAPDAYRVLATAPNGSTAAGTFTRPFDDKDLENFVLRVGRARQVTRAYRSSQMQRAKQFGAALFDSVFRGDVRDAYVHARRAADEAENRGLRITLYLSGAPELLDVPWEFLWDRPMFLAQSIYTPIVRSLDLPVVRKPLKLRLPLRILGMISRPRGFTGLNVQREKRTIERALSALKRSGLVELQWMESATLRELERSLSAPRDIHVFHYVGHGGYDENSGQSLLVLEDEQRGPHEVSGEELGSLFYDKRTLRLAVLNACEGSRGSYRDPFSGVAASLVEHGIQAVIGMQFEISDPAAISFAEGIYTGLAYGYPADAALAQARKTIFAAGYDTEFATPVLFLQSGDARLFELDQLSATVISSHAEQLAERLAKEQADREEAARLAKEQADREEAARLAKEQADRKVKEEFRRRAVAAALVAVALLLAGVGFLLVRWINSAGGQASIQIPKVIHLRAAEAKTRLEDLGFKVRRVPMPSRIVAKDLVIATTPAAGQRAPRNEIITMRISTGAWIAFASKEKTAGSACKPCNWDIYVMPPEGGVPMNITNNPAYDLAPAWSPDGSKIAFVSSRQDRSPTACGHSCNYEIYVMNADGTGVQRITNAPYRDGSPTWSPDGKRIAFHSNRDDRLAATCDDPNVCNFNIFVMNADGTGVKRLTSSLASDSSPRWSPRGNRIAFNTSRDGNPEIYTIDLSTRQMVNITHDSRDDASPSWSPTGDRIAFRRIVGYSNYDIWIVDADGSGAVPFISGSDREAQPVWSPDGTSIAFFVGREDHKVIAANRADGTGSIQTLTSTDGEYDTLAW